MKVTSIETKNIVILGGYGNFGKRIAESLLDINDVNLLIAGRNQAKASEICKHWADRSPRASLKPIKLDINSLQLEDDLRDLAPFLVIHTGGSFQGQDYRVPEACINVGAHYIDLADDRRFVCDITKLNQKAQNQGVLVVSGASSVPGLSSTVIDHYLPRFQTLKNIDFAISPGNKAERGEATIRAILSYTGHPFKIFRNNQWINVFGWGESRKRDFSGTIGTRLLANIDIPDLELFPVRYPSVESVQFQAGLELSILHYGMCVLSKLAEYKLVKSWEPLTKLIVKASELFLPFGSDRGGMQVTLEGLDQNGENLRVDWTLYANDGVGPYIPTISTIILARKLIDHSIARTGAMACQGMYTLDEFDLYAKQWDIYHTEVINHSMKSGSQYGV